MGRRWSISARARGPEEAALRLPETAETALAAMTALAMYPALPRPLGPQYACKPFSTCIKKYRYGGSSLRGKKNDCPFEIKKKNNLRINHVGREEECENLKSEIWFLFAHLYEQFNIIYRSILIQVQIFMQSQSSAFSFHIIYLIRCHTKSCTSTCRSFNCLFKR